MGASRGALRGAVVTSPWEAAWERARQLAPFAHRPKRGREDGIAFEAGGAPPSLPTGETGSEAAAYLRGRSCAWHCAAMLLQWRAPEQADEQIVESFDVKGEADTAAASRFAPVAAEPSASTGAVVGEDAGSRQETIRGGGRVEVRHKVDDAGKPHLDEVIARGANVHLESMSESDWLLILEWADGRRVDVWIGSRSGRAAVDGRVTEDSGGEQ